MKLIKTILIIIFHLSLCFCNAQTVCDELFLEAKNQSKERPLFLINYLNKLLLSEDCKEIRHQEEIKKYINELKIDYVKGLIEDEKERINKFELGTARRNLDSIRNNSLLKIDTVTQAVQVLINQIDLIERVQEKIRKASDESKPNLVEILNNGNRSLGFIVGENEKNLFYLNSTISSSESNEKENTILKNSQVIDAKPIAKNQDPPHWTLLKSSKSKFVKWNAECLAPEESIQEEQIVLLMDLQLDEVPPKWGKIKSAGEKYLIIELANPISKNFKGRLIFSSEGIVGVAFPNELNSLQVINIWHIRSWIQDKYPIKSEKVSPFKFSEIGNGYYDNHITNSLRITGITTGVLAIGSSMYLELSAKSRYKNYSTYVVPNGQFYTNLGTNRATYFSNLKNRHRAAIGLATGGAAILFGTFSDLFFPELYIRDGEFIRAKLNFFAFSPYSHSGFNASYAGLGLQLNLTF